MKRRSSRHERRNSTIAALAALVGAIATVIGTVNSCADRPREDAHPTSTDDGTRLSSR